MNILVTANGGRLPAAFRRRSIGCGTKLEVKRKYWSLMERFNKASMINEI